MKLPNGYDSDIADRGAILLRAHRQRLGLARALCGNPRLVVLDEPNASLDYAGEQMLFNAIEKMKAANTIVIVITHRMGILKATDKIAIMQGGTLAAFGVATRFMPDISGRPRSMFASGHPRASWPGARRIACLRRKVPGEIAGADVAIGVAT